MKTEILKLISMKLAGKKPLKEKDLQKDLATMVPTPIQSLRKKFNFFYEPYNQTCNTKKYMTFDEPEQPTNQLPRKSITWAKIDHFIRKEDERVKFFVIN